MKKYQSYKPSGIEWIGDIPEHWEKIKLSYLMEDDGFRSGPFGSSLITSELVEKGEIRVLSPEFITRGIEDYPLFVPKERELELSKYLVKEGDIVIPIVGTLGRGKIIKDKDPKGILNQRLCRITPKQSKININLLELLLTKSELIRVQYNLEKRGSILDHITKEIIFNFVIPLPPLTEQLQIVQFLDEKTELIDKLISTKERKIDLLKQQRTSLINEVITKGLNPNVKMKDSGDEWIGKIPEKWNVLKLKYISDLRISSVDKHIFENENQVRVCNYTDVYYNEFISSKLIFRNGSCSDDELQKYTLNNGDVIITKDSESPNDIGVPSLVVEDIENLVCGYHLSIIKPNLSKMIGGFLFRQLQTKRIRNYYEVCSNGITRFGLGKSSVLETPLIVPPIKEQQQIVEYLDTRTKEIDDLVSMEQKKIDLLKEYRQSLISEVITGKIDVRTNLN